MLSVSEASTDEKFNDLCKKGLMQQRRQAAKAAKKINQSPRTGCKIMESMATHANTSLPAHPHTTHRNKSNNAAMQSGNVFLVWPRTKPTLHRKCREIRALVMQLTPKSSDGKGPQRPNRFIFADVCTVPTEIGWSSEVERFHTSFLGCPVAS